MSPIPAEPPPLQSEILDRLARIEAAVQLLVREKTVKEWYTTGEVAALLGKADYTVREWCRLGRVRAAKKTHARGAYQEWLIAHAELCRVQNEGLLQTVKTVRSFREDTATSLVQPIRCRGTHVFLDFSRLRRRREASRKPSSSEQFFVPFSRNARRSGSLRTEQWPPSHVRQGDRQECPQIANGS